MALLKNFGYSVVAVAPSPADSGGTLTVSAGHGDRFTIGRELTIYPSGLPALKEYSEIVVVTNIVGDVLSITRAQSDTIARTVLIGDQLAMTFTAKEMNALETAIASRELTQVVASQAEAEAGTEAALRSFSPLRIAQAIAALAAGGGGGVASRQTASNATGDTTLTAIAADIIQHTAVVTFTGTAGERNVALPVANRVAGDRAVVKFIFPTTDAIVVNLKNDTTGGATLYTFTTDTSGDDASCEVEFDGSAWGKLRFNYPI
jgi:hypothetical protein